MANNKSRDAEHNYDSNMIKKKASALWRNLTDASIIAAVTQFFKFPFPTTGG